jgi:hypothetical protein
MYVIHTKYGYVQYAENGVTYRYVQNVEDATTYQTSNAAMDARPNAPGEVKQIGSAVLKGVSNRSRGAHSGWTRRKDDK